MRMQGLSGRNLGCGFPVLSLMHSCVPSDWGKFYTGGMRSQYSTAFSGQRLVLVACMDHGCITNHFKTSSTWHIITSRNPFTISDIMVVIETGTDLPWNMTHPPQDSWLGCWVKDHNPNRPHGPSGPATQWLSRRWAWWNRTRMAAAWSPRTSLEVDKRY